MIEMKLLTHVQKISKRNRYGCIHFSEIPSVVSETRNEFRDELGFSCVTFTQTTKKS